MGGLVVDNKKKPEKAPSASIAMPGEGGKNVPALDF
jgi:hypothetical protein